MNSLRRHLLKGATAAGSIALTAGLLSSSNAFAGFSPAAFSAKTLADALTGMDATAAINSTDIIIKAPEIAENGAVVPVEITSNIANTVSISILAEKNPNPLLAHFNFTNGAVPFVATRIKMAQTAMVRAIVTTADGTNYTATKQVKVTIGGCGG